MSTASISYPQHIYDQNRIDLALTIVEKESRKLLLGVPPDAFKKIDESMRGWVENPLSYHLEDDGPREFWDIFAALIESVKLKSNFTALITAENITWHRMPISIRNIQMTSSLAQLQKVPGLNVRNDLPFFELADVLEGKPDVAEEQKKLVDAHSTDPAQDRYPVIVVETENGLFEVIDGNRRTLKALLYGNNTIDAWVGNTNKSAPINFWAPLNDMFQLVKVYKQAVGAGDEELKVAAARVLKARFESSNVARVAYQNRIGNQTKLAGELFELAQSL